MNYWLALLISLGPVCHIAISPDMAREIFKVRDFSRELITNVDSGDLPDNAARTFDNIRADQLGRMRGIPGNASFATGPSPIAGDLRWFQEVVINDVQVIICWGLDSQSTPIQHFYFTVDGGSTWIEMTEVHRDTLDGATTSPDTSFQIITGNANIGLGWLVLTKTAVGGIRNWDYVLTYTAGTNTVTTKYGLPTESNGSDIIFVRFPIWRGIDLQPQAADNAVAQNIVRDQDNFKPKIIQRQEGVAIYTGFEPNDTSGVNPHQFRNLWFSFLETGDIFDDSDLAWDDYHCTRKDLFRPVGEEVIASTSAQAEANDPLDNGAGTQNYAVIVNALYDGYQESDQLIYGVPGGINIDIPSAIVQAITANTLLRINISISRMFAELEIPAPADFRRITSLRVYIAQVDSIDGGSNFEATTPFFLVREILLTDTGWAGGGSGAATFSNIDIRQREFNYGQAAEMEFNRGHISSLLVNSDMATVAKGREIVGAIRYDSDDLWRLSGLTTGRHGIGRELPANNAAYLIPCAVNSALRSTPDATPIGSIVNMGDRGIYVIKAMESLGDRLVVFGENLVDIEEFGLQGKLTPVETIRERGIKGLWSVNSDGDFVRWGNQDSIYQLSEAGQLEEIGLPIRDEWQALSSDNRKTSIASYAPEQDLFILHSQSDETFIFDTLRKTWRKYKSATSWEWLSTGIDGELLATDKTDIFELFAGTPTEALTATYEKDFEFEREVQFTEFWLNYVSTTLIKVFIYDLEVGTDFPVCEPLLFFPQTVPETQKETASFVAQRIRVQIVKQNSTDQDWLINGYGGYGEPFGILTEGGKES